MDHVSPSSVFLGGQKFPGVKKSLGLKFSRVSTIFGGQHFWGVNIFIGVHIFGGSTGGGFRVLACTDMGARTPLECATIQ